MDAPSPPALPVPPEAGPSWRIVASLVLSLLGFVISILIGFYVRTNEVQLAELKRQIEGNVQWNKAQDLIDYNRNATIVQMQGQLANDRESIRDLYQHHLAFEDRVRALERAMDRYLNMRQNREAPP